MDHAFVTDLGDYEVNGTTLSFPKCRVVFYGPNVDANPGAGYDSSYAPFAIEPGDSAATISATIVAAVLAERDRLATLGHAYDVDSSRVVAPAFVRGA